MSIAVAIKKDNHVVLATDSQTTFGATSLGANNLTTKKIRRIGSAYLATTGWGLYEDMLRDFVESRKQPPRLNNQKAIFSFFLKFWKQLHEKYSYVNDQPNEKDSPFGDLDSSFLIVNSSGIYHVASDMSVTKFEKYFAIGSGCDYALGVVYALYDELEAKELAKRAVDAAAHFNVYCGGPLNLIELKAR